MLAACQIGALSPSLRIAELVDVCEHLRFVGFDGVAVHRVLGEELAQSDCHVALLSSRPGVAPRGAAMLLWPRDHAMVIGRPVR